MLNTFIFFDLETTGLITNNCMPKITELSLIAVSRSAISDTTRTLPRVLSKLVLPINPVKSICQKVETITGLSSQNLENVEPFTWKTHDLIIDFIKRLIPPVCFVAYNGYKYDYPIFLTELENINKAVGEEILCIDMLHLIKNFFSSIDLLCKESIIQANTSTSYDTENSDILLDDEWNDILSDALDNTEYDCFNDSNETCVHQSKRKETCFTNISGIPNNNHYEEMQKANEKTPESQKIRHPSTNLLNGRDNKTRRKLDFVDTKPSNFKLTTVYKHICGTDPLNAHTAEADCLFMIECAIRIKQFFLEWADHNAVPMISYKK